MNDVSAKSTDKVKLSEAVLRARIVMLERVLGSLTEIAQAGGGFLSEDQIRAFLDGKSLDARQMTIITAAVAKVETIRGIGAGEPVKPPADKNESLEREFGPTKAGRKSAEAHTASSATSRAASAQPGGNAGPGAPEVRGEAPKAHASAKVEPVVSDAGIAFMITNAMKAALRAKGFSDDDIAAMTPDDAHKLLKGDQRAGQTPKLERFQPPASPPAELVRRKQWIGWRERWNPIKEKFDKLPICIPTGNGADFLNPSQQVDYDAAVAAIKKQGLSGIGFALVRGCGLIGGDIDNCRDPKTCVIEPWAWTIVNFKETYCEVSPSGKGVRIFALGDLPKGESAITHHPAGIELYTSGHFLTFSGKHIDGTPPDVLPAERTIAALIARIEEVKAKNAGQEGSGKPSTRADAKRGEDDDAQAFSRAVLATPPASLARIELGLDAPRSEDEMQLAALVDLAESILPIPGAWRACAEALGVTVAQLRIEIANALVARLGVPAPRRNKFRKSAIERALAKPGLAVVTLIGSRSHSAANVSAALEAAEREVNVFQ